MSDQSKNPSRPAPVPLGLVPDSGEPNLGLPGTWSPADSAPSPVAAGGPLTSPMNPRFMGSIPSTLQLQTDLVSSSYPSAGNPNVPGQRLMPLAPSGTPGVNAAVQSQTPGIVAKSTAANIAGQGTLATSNSVDPTTSQLKDTGSIPPSASSPFEYTSTSSSINLFYDGNFILRADGTSLTVPNGSTNITGLQAGKTYAFFPYWDEQLGQLEFVSFNSNIPNLAGVTLNGSTGLVTSTTSISRLISDPFSLEIWFKSVAASAGVLIELNANHTGAPSTTAAINGIAMEAAGTIRGLVQHNAGGASPVPYNDGVWHQAVLTFAGGTGTAVVLYIDGAQANAGTATGTTQSGFWRIGNGGVEAASEFFKGTLAHASVWNFVLTAAQVANHFNVMQNTGPANYITVVLGDGPLYYWELAESSGTAAADSSSGGTNTGLYTGGFTLNQSQAVLTPIGTPAIAWDSSSPQLAQQQNLRQFTALSNGAITAATTSGGTGGGVTSGSQVASCFSGNTLVKTDRGAVEIQHIKIGDEVFTARGTWRKVIQVIQHEFDDLAADMGGCEFVTGSHRVLNEGKWVAASSLFHDWRPIKGLVYNISVESEVGDNPDAPDSENSFTLRNGLVCHNLKMQR